jgi:hypothetical protein
MPITPKTGSLFHAETQFGSGSEAGDNPAMASYRLQDFLALEISE